MWHPSILMKYLFHVLKVSLHFFRSMGYVASDRNRLFFNLSVASAIQDNRVGLQRVDQAPSDVGWCHQNDDDRD